jgi:hypothetical protein
MFRFFKRNKNKTIQPENSVDSNWANLVGKAMKDYNSLTKNERIWFNLRVLIDSFNNGGLASYYYNSGAENVYETIEDLQILGLDKLATIIKKYNEILFHDTKVPKDINERNEIVSKLDEKTDSLLQDIELDFQDQLETLERRLETFINKEMN